jgi:hypothetical protein
VTVDVALRIRASQTCTEVVCPFCGQAPGQTCVTASLNEATFPHQDRVHLRLAQLAAQ